jgi:excisionase family DNA binding protein
MENRTLSLSEVAGLMGVSERTIRRWIKAGKLRAYKPGRDYRIPESALRQFVEESEISPKALAPPSLFNGLEEERRIQWENALENARLLRQTGRARLEELLSSWRESKDREEAADTRQGLRAEMGQLLQEAFDATNAVLENIETGLAMPDPRLASARPGESFPNPGWEEVRAADGFYWALREMVEGAGLYIRTESAQVGQPEVHNVGELEAA